MTSKSELRHELSRARQQLPPKEIARLSALITQQLITLVDWLGVTSLHCYEPIKRQGEVDITPLVDFLARSFPRIERYTSRKINGDWHIVRQPDGAMAGEQTFDCIIVPMLGFDECLHRLGYGGGYYDRMLAAQPSAQKIGVCFEQGKVANVPIEPHDIALNSITTELQTYRNTDD